MVSKMAKIISKGHLPKDHPIYTGRWVFSPSGTGFKRPEKKRTQNNEWGHQKVTPIIKGRKHETNCQRSLGIGISTRWAPSWQLHLVCVQPLNSSVKSSFRAILTTILLPVLRGCFFVTRFVACRVGWLFSAGFRASPSGS